jgi:hypothetical protein
VLECEVGSAVVFETHMQQSADEGGILHAHDHTGSDSVVANNTVVQFGGAITWARGAWATPSRNRSA